MLSKRAELQPRLLHVYTGPSKGKTTASVGLAVRAVGAGWKVLFCSFFKPDGSSEHEALAKLGVDVKRFAWRGTFFKNYTQKELQEQRTALKQFLREVQIDWEHVDLVIMDEVVYAVTSNIISETEFLSFLDSRPPTVELALTGRDFPASILERANYITEMKQVKHPFDSGHMPRKGIEF